MVKVLFRHSIHAFNQLPSKKELDQKQNLRIALLRSLPKEFSSSEYLKSTTKLNISRSNAYKILKLFIQEDLVIKMTRNKYLLKETKDLWGDQFQQENNSSES